MRFFADQCVPRSIGETLDSEGHEVIRLSARLPVDAEDSAVIEEAQKIGAILLSLNGDFADLLRYPPEEYGGIVALQVRELGKLTIGHQPVSDCLDPGSKARPAGCKTLGVGPEGFESLNEEFDFRVGLVVAG